MLILGVGRGLHRGVVGARSKERGKEEKNKNGGEQEKSEEEEKKNRVDGKNKGEELNNSNVMHNINVFEGPKQSWGKCQTKFISNLCNNVLKSTKNAFSLCS